MTEIIGVRFKSSGKQYYFDPNGLTVEEGQDVVVETSRGAEYGQCVQGNTHIEDEAVVQPLRPVLRVATAEDAKVIERNKEKEARALQICQEKILAHGLEMKLVDVEYSFEGNKVLFFFTAEGRVDFRALVKDLASTIHARIELRQIGVRDEAKMLGGLGICGRPFCCSQFLDEFQPVSIKMAKTQNLSLNPTKISGTCGRLMCCLKYEQDAYEDLVKHTPKQDSFVETPDGAGTVSSVNLLRQQIQVRLESDPETPHCYHNCEVCVIRNGKGKRPEGYVEPPLEELAKLRKPVEEDIPEPTRAPASPLAAALEAVFNGEVPQMEGISADQEEREVERRSRRNRPRRPRGGAPRKEGQPAQESEAPVPKTFKPTQKAPVREEKPPQEGGERPKREPKPRPEGQSRPKQERPPRPSRPPKAEGEQSAPAQAPAEAGGEGRSRERRPFNRRKRRPPRGNGGKPQGGGQE